VTLHVIVVLVGVPGDSRAQRPDEGRRVLRNVASFGAFVLSPLHVVVLNRALGPAGYGHWWWTFGIIEAASLLGMFSADLYVRREVPRLPGTDVDASRIAVIGSSLAVAVGLGLVLLAIQLALAQPLAESQRDPGLLPFLVVLAIQPVLWNIGAVLVAALQSIDVLISVAILRGLVVPAATIVVLYLAAVYGWSTSTTLGLLVTMTVISLAMLVAIYARHFPLRQTLLEVVRARQIRQVFAFGVALLPPSVLFTAGGKIDVYVLGREVDAGVVGVYAGCLTLAATLPALRGLFDPIVQRQIGALHGLANQELRESLARLTRLCLLALAPPLVMLVAVGEPVLGYLLGRPVPYAMVPLAILCVGQLFGSIAIAGWLIPMGLERRVLVVIAAVTLVVKLVLLFLLVPAFGLLGAAIATAAGTIIAQQGQALIGARRLEMQPYQASMLPLLVITGVIAAGGRVLYGVLEEHASTFAAFAITTGCTVAVLGPALWWLLDAEERSTLVRTFRRGARDGVG